MLDPFGGSGTTYVAAELTGRRWIGAELDCSAVLERFDALDGDREHMAQIQANKNTLFTRADLDRRQKSGWPISPNYRLDPTIQDPVHCVCPESKAEQAELFIAN